MTRKKRRKFEGFNNFSFGRAGIDGTVKAGKMRTRTEIRVERFAVDQMDMYIKLHKEHEKDLSYIG